MKKKHNWMSSTLKKLTKSNYNPFRSYIFDRSTHMSGRAKLNFHFTTSKIKNKFLKCHKEINVDQSKITSHVLCFSGKEIGFATKFLQRHELRSASPMCPILCCFFRDHVYYSTGNILFFGMYADLQINFHRV